MRDPYDALGVSRSASDEEIKQAYRRLVKESHPDLNPGDPVLEQRFKEVTSAYDLLRDREKRERFDRGEIDAEGQPRAAWNHARRGRRPNSRKGFSAQDIFEDIFGRGGFKTRGADLSYTLAVDFLEAVNGTRKRLVLTDGREIDVTVPPGTDDRQTLRLKGQGTAGMGGGEPGDAYVEVRVEPHPHFRRDGANVHLDVPVSLKEAVLGASIAVPTVGGRVNVKVPAGANTGTVLRLRGKGVQGRGGNAAGDLYVTLKVVLPDPLDAALTDFVRGWTPKGQTDPRKKAGLT